MASSGTGTGFGDVANGPPDERRSLLFLSPSFNLAPNHLQGLDDARRYFFDLRL